MAEAPAPRPKRVLAVALGVLGFVILVAGIAPYAQLGGLGPLPLLFASGVAVTFAVRVLEGGDGRAIDAVGLGGPAPIGVGLGLLMAAPMAGVLALARPLSLGPQWTHGLRVALATALAEELVFRGYAMRALTRRAGLSALRAAVITSVAFALSHVAAAAGKATPAELVEIAALGLATAGWMAWLFVAWSDALWAPLALHFGMNLAWGAFEGPAVSSNDHPGVLPHVARLASVAASIAVTLAARRFTSSSAPSGRA